MMLVNHLEIPQVTYVKEILKYEDNNIDAIREIEEGLETIRVELPALICIVKGYSEPTRATIDGVKKAQNFVIKTYSAEDIGLTPEETGLKGSPTYVSRAFRPEHNRGECSICTDCNELASKITQRII